MRRPSGWNRWRPDGRPFRTHQCLVRQRTQLINALRGHLAEFGLVAPKGPASLKVLETALADETSALPGAVREMGTIYVEQIARLTELIERLANELEAASKTDVQLRRLCTIPGIGPVTAVPSRRSHRISIHSTADATSPRRAESTPPA